MNDYPTDAECELCGGWIELGVNDVLGYCHSCDEWVNNMGKPEKPL